MALFFVEEANLSISTQLTKPPHLPFIFCDISDVCKDLLFAKFAKLVISKILVWHIYFQSLALNVGFFVVSAACYPKITCQSNCEQC